MTEVALESKPPTLGPMPKVKLTAVQAKQWDETRSATLWAQPAFSDIWYNMMASGDDLACMTDAIPSLAATDGTYMYINPNPMKDKTGKNVCPGFFDLKLDERMFVACHEIFHAILDHCIMGYNLQRQGKINYPDGKSLPYDHDLMNVAMDLVINDNLVENKVGSMPVWPAGYPEAGKQLGMWRGNEGFAEMSVLDAYRKIYKEEQGKGGKGKPQPGQGQGGFDSLLDPGQGQGKTPESAKAERNDAAWATAVAAAIASAKLQGNLPAGLERMLGKAMEPEVDWADKLRSSLTRKLGQSGGSWEQLEQSLIIRGVGAPGRVAYGAGLIVVAVDTSGSVTQPMMDRMMAEVGGILDDVRPRELVFVQCDADVHEWVECDDSADLMRKKLRGGGGTDFRPVFDRIEKEGLAPDALIYFTDGYGSFPRQAPGYPVVWGSLTPDHKYPFGDVVFVPLKGM